MGLLKRTKPQTVMASAPEEPETQAEIKHIENLTESKTEEPVINEEPVKSEGYPVCMSQVQINNIVIENNMMLKHIISEMG